MCKLRVWGLALFLLTFLPAAVSARECVTATVAVDAPYVGYSSNYRYRDRDDWRWRRHHREDCRRHHGRHCDRDRYYR